jgi:hypothetical protein
VKMPRPTPTDRTYVGSRTVHALATVILIVGAIAAVAGVSYAINGATVAPAHVRVPVSLQTDPGETGDPVRVAVDGVSLPDSTYLEAEHGDLLLSDWTGNSRWTGFLARADSALGGLAVGVCAVLLAPVLRSLGDGDPFRGGNAARIGAVGGIVMIAGTVAPLLPQIASLVVIDGLGLVSPGSPLVPGISFSFVPVAVGALVLAVAEAFRRGTQLTDDTRGLV